MNDKKTLVFLHGWGVNSKIFELLFYYIKDDFEIFTMDLPGFGQTPIEKSMTLKDYADFVHKFLKDNKIEQPIIIGHSFGGAITVKFSLLYPNEISKLILVSASAIRHPNTKTKIIRKISKIFNPLVSEKIKFIILRILKLEKSDYAVIQNPLLKETFKNVINEDLVPFLSSIKIPTLVIWGEKDIVTPLAEGELIATSIPGAKLEIIKNAGHFPFLEKPEEFIKLIKEFAL